METPENGGEERVIEPEEETAEPQQMDPEAVRRRAEAPDLLPPEELDRRQEVIREDRRKGGPDLDAETDAREEAQEDVPDLPPTEPEEPAEPEEGA